jgi:hypothetical protein
MSCCTTLNHIARECGSGIRPGLNTKVYVACKDDVATIPADNGTSHTIASNITMASTKTFKIWDISQFDSSYLSEPQGDLDARFFANTVSFFIPALAAGKTNIFNSITGGEFIVIIQDAKGQNRLLGDLVRGAYITVQEQTNDKNGYLVTINWESNETPYFYTGTITT